MIIAEDSTNMTIINNNIYTSIDCGSATINISDNIIYAFDTIINMIKLDPNISSKNNIFVDDDKTIINICKKEKNVNDLLLRII